MAELRSTSPDQTPGYYDSPASDLEKSLTILSAGGPVARTVSFTLPQAMQMALDGELQPDELYQQLPLAVKSFFDESASEFHGKTFQRLTLDTQRQLIRAVLEAMTNATDAPGVASKTPRAPVARRGSSTERKTNKTAPDGVRPQRSLTRLAIAVLLLAALAATFYLSR